MLCYNLPMPINKCGREWSLTFVVGLVGVRLEVR